MAINLSRNTKLFISTVKSTLQADHSPADTIEIQIKDGYSFSQDAASQTITLSEAGDSPIRGQKIFTTARNPAEVSIPAYARPYFSNDQTGCLEQILWEAMVGDGTPPAISTASVGTNAKRSMDYMEANFKNSNKHELLKLYLFFNVDNAVYRVNDFALNAAEVDFSISEISLITWAGQGSQVEEILESGASGSKLSEILAWDAGTAYLAASTAHLGNTDPGFITNKLSTMSIKRVTGTTSASWGVDYNNSLSVVQDHSMDGTKKYRFTVDTDTFPSTVVIDSSVSPW